MRPLNASLIATATDIPVIPTPESPIVAKAENNPQEQVLLLTEDEGPEMETNAKLSEALSTERILLQLQLIGEKTLNDQNFFLKLLKSQSES